jgi:hypothetical protein
VENELPPKLIAVKLIAAPIAAPPNSPVILVTTLLALITRALGIERYLF